MTNWVFRATPGDSKDGRDTWSLEIEDDDGGAMLIRNRAAPPLHDGDRSMRALQRGPLWV